MYWLTNGRQVELNLSEAFIIFAVPFGDGRGIDITLFSFKSHIKGLLHHKMKILSLLTYPHVVPTP